MRKRFLSIITALALVFGFGLAATIVAPQASALGVFTEHLTVTNPLDGYHADVVLHYDIVWVREGHWQATNVTGSLNTTPNFQMNRLVVAIETSPGTYAGVAVYGGSQDTLNDVDASYTIGIRGPYGFDGADTPAWQMLAYGVGPGNSVVNGSDYGEVFCC